MIARDEFAAPPVTVALLASAARMATVDSDDQMNTKGRGAHVIIDVTAISATPSVVPHIQGFDPLSGKYYDLLIGIPILETGTTVLKLYPGIVASPNVAASDILPRHWRLRMVHANTDSITYSAAAQVIE
jgi:hypothetical protein